MVASSSNEGDETNESSSPSMSGAVTDVANPSVSEKRAEGRAEVKKGRRTALVTWGMFVLLWVGYLVLIQSIAQHLGRHSCSITS